MMGRYHSTDRISGDVVESVILNCIPGQNVQVFGIADWLCSGVWEYYFIVRLQYGSDGVLSSNQFLLSSETEAETGLLCRDRARLVRPGCSIPSLVEVRGSFQKTVQTWLLGALGSKAAPLEDHGVNGALVILTYARILFERCLPW